MSPKMGRPVVGSPKTNDVKVRLDDETHNKLLEYCKEKGITKAEAIRQGIHLLLQNKRVLFHRPKRPTLYMTARSYLINLLYHICS